MTIVKSLFIGVIAFVFIACVNNKSGVININEVDYPDGINVIIHNKDLRSDLEIISTRLVNSKYKKQVQLVINNTSSDTYYMIIGHEWTDSRGSIINNHMLKSRITLKAAKVRFIATQ